MAESANLYSSIGAALPSPSGRRSRRNGSHGVVWRRSRAVHMQVVQNVHHVLWIREHWKLDGIVGGGAVFAITYSILNAVRNKTLNSKVLSILRERATPMTEQEISRLLDIPLARLQQRIDSLFGQGLIEPVPGPHWQERAWRGWRTCDRRTTRPGG